MDLTVVFHGFLLGQKIETTPEGEWCVAKEHGETM